MINPRGILDRPQMVQSLQVASIADLRAADPAQWLELEIMALVLGEAAANDGGGAIFYWSPTSTATDDGVYAVKPNNRTGAGRWLRHITENGGEERFLVDVYGAVGDGVADDSQALIDAFTDANGAWVVGGGPTKRYRLTSIAAFSGQDVFFDGRGCTLVLDANIHAFDISMPFTEVQTVSSLTHASRNYGSTSTTVLRAVVSNGAVYPANTYCKIISNDLLTGPDPADEERWGEFFKVGNTSTNQLDMYSAMREPVPGFAPTGTIKIGKLNSTNRVYLKNFKIDLTDNAKANPNWARSQIIIRGAFRPIVENVGCDYSNAIHLEYISCYQPLDINVKPTNCQTDSALGALGYGRIWNSCFGGISYGMQADNVRHAGDDGCRNSSADDDDFYDRGRTIDCVTINGNALNCQAAPWSTHAEALNCGFIGCTGPSGYAGSSIGTVVAYTLRGIANYVVCARTGSNDGVEVNMDYGNAWNSRDHCIYGPYYRTNENISNNVRESLLVRGQDATYRAVNIRVFNPVFDITAASTSPAIYAQYGDVTVFNPVATVTTSGASAELIETAENSTVRLFGGFADFSGLTGSNYVIVKSRTNTSTTIWNEPTFIGMANVQAFASFQNTNGTVRLLSARTDGFCIDSNGTIDDSGTETFELTFRDGNKRIIDEVSATNNTNTDITTLITSSSNVTPTITDGTEVLSATITPKRTSSTIKCTVSLFGGLSAAGTLTAALFRGSTFIEARPLYLGAALTQLGSIHFTVEDAPSSTSAQTYSVRVGSDDGAGVALTARLNGTHAGRRYGTSVKATLLLEEIGL